MTTTAVGTNRPSGALRRKAWWAIATGVVLVAFSTVLLGLAATIDQPSASEQAGWAERAPTTSEAEPAPAPRGDDSEPMPHIDAGPPVPAPRSAPASQAAPGPSPTWAETAAMVSAVGGLISGFAGLVTALVGVATMRRAGRVVGRATVGD
jgi:hypothetical protein